MTDVSLVDVSLRDGNQSVWGAVGVRTRMIGKMAPCLDPVGYRAIELVSSTIIAVAVRFHHEDPWAKIDLARRLAPNTRLGFLTTGKRFISFGRTPAPILRLAYDLLRRHGITRMWVIDPMHDMQATRDNARVAKEVGFEEVVAGICYTRSPVHSDAYYADKVAEIDDCADIDSVYIKDPAGLLTPERLETLHPMMQSRLSRLKIDEIHSHCNTGMAPLTLLKAADLGVRILHCALPPVANGNSHPPGPQLVRNLLARGHRVDVDLDAMEAASRCLTREATLHGLASAVPNDYDEAYYRHTVPGGVIATARRQLAEMGRAALLPRVIEESVRVREDLGWPIVVTPFAQYIVTQATINILTGERYSRISDEVVDLLLGDFGPMPGAVDGELLERAHATTRARHRKADAAEPTIADFRQRFGVSIPDEELLLRAVMPAGQVDAMVKASGRGNDRGFLELVRVLNDPQRPLSVQVRTSDINFSITGVRSAKGGQ